MTIFKSILIRSLRKKFLLIAMCAIPLAMAFVRPLWSLDDGMGFSFYGMVILFCAFSLSQFIMNDRVTGLAVRIFVAPVTTFKYLAQNLLAFWLMISVQIFAVLIIATFLYAWNMEMLVHLMLAYVIFATSCIAFSLAWNSIFHSKAVSSGVFSIVIFFMGILGGLFVPFSMLPDQLRIIGMIFPTYWLSNSLQFILIQNISGEFWRSICIMLLLTVIFLLYGSKRRLE